MDKFLKKFSTIPHKFINGFYEITKEEYDNNEIIIDFDKVYKWLSTRKDDLKKILVKNFEEEFDYTITIKKKKQKNSTGLTTYHEIYVTPNCFKELCMISQTQKARDVRKYFIEMEKLVKKYYDKIKKEMYKEIGLLKYNHPSSTLCFAEKPKNEIKGGVIYILRAFNTNVTLYKLGKTKDLKNRLKTYNSGNANDVEPEFIIPVKDVDSAENCIKSVTKKFQYRHYKEVYDIDLGVLKELIEKCTDISNKLQKYYDAKKKETRQKISRMKKNDDRYFIYIDK